MGGRQPRRRPPVDPPADPEVPVRIAGHQALDVWPWPRPTIPAEDLDLDIGQQIPFVLVYPNLQEFSAWSVCPRCGRWDLHWLERTSQVVPTVISTRSDTATYQVWGYGPVKAPRVGGSPDAYVLSRHDERSAEVIRRCRGLSCRYRWPEGRADMSKELTVRVNTR